MVVEPSGPCTETDAWEGVSFTDGGMTIGSLPICEVCALARAVEVKERYAGRRIMVAPISFSGQVI